MVFAAVGVLANCNGGVSTPSLIPPLLVGEDANKSDKKKIISQSYNHSFLPQLASSPTATAE
jgi:hypothetical protein